MRSDAATLGRIALLALGLVCLPTIVSGQPSDNLARLSGDLTPAEVQQLFDAFELVRAQEMLDLSDEQYPQFVVMLKNLQEHRRRVQQQRQRLLRELQRLSTRANADETALEERLATLSQLELDAAAAGREAMAAVDGLLTVRQQARFRIFQQAMERRRIELLFRARRNQPQRRQQDTRPR